MEVQRTSTAGSRQTRKLSKVLRGLLVTIAGLTAFSLGWYFVEFYRCSRHTPTGDALFDKYARALIRRHSGTLFAAGWKMGLSLPDEQLEQWRDEFGSKPEYWQLRYFNALNLEPRDRISPDESVESRCHSLAAHVLDEAAIAGCVDPVLASLRYREARWRSYKETSPEARRAASQISSSTRLGLDAWATESPDSPWPYYTETVEHIAKKDYQEALDALMKADAIPFSPEPDCYPLNHIKDYLSVNDGIMGARNGELLGALLCGESPPFLLAYSGVYNDHSGFEAWTCEQGHIEGLAAWYRFGCRLGLRPVAYPEGPYMSLLIIQRSLYRILEMPPVDLYPEQRQVLLTALARQSRLQEGLFAYRGQVWHFYQYMDQWGIMGATADWSYLPPEDPSWGLRGLPRHLWLMRTPAGYRQVARLSADELWNHKEHTAPEFKALAAIDLAQPKLPLDWLFFAGDRMGVPSHHPDGPHADMWGPRD